MHYFHLPRATALPEIDNPFSSADGLTRQLLAIF